MREKTITISEAELTNMVIELAQRCGWLCVHFRPARVVTKGRETWRTALQGDGAGFPDIVALKSKRLVVAELKSQDAPGPTADQVMWQDAFREVGAEVFLWRPSDWDTIVEILGEGRLS